MKVGTATGEVRLSYRLGFWGRLALVISTLIGWLFELATTTILLAGAYCLYRFAEQL
jgi:hypothetical protein